MPIVSRFARCGSRGGANRAREDRMNNNRRIGAMVALATAAVGMAATGAAAPAAAPPHGPRGPQPVSSWLRPVKAHTDSLVSIYFRTDRRACDAVVRVFGNDLEVDYP